MSAALIAKLESASEGSRELDLWIEGASYGSIGRLVGTTRDVPAYTTSIDAALALAERVLPGWFWSVRKNVTTGYLATLFALNEPPWTGSAYEKMEQGTASTPALAICAAILRASAAEGTGE